MFAPERFIREEIARIVAQIQNPITREPYKEVPALVADLVYWHGKLREVEAEARDWAVAA